jgi:hypothetical protein
VQFNTKKLFADLAAAQQWPAVRVIGFARTTS